MRITLCGPVLVTALPHDELLVVDEIDVVEFAPSDQTDLMDALRRSVQEQRGASAKKPALASAALP